MAQQKRIQINPIVQPVADCRAGRQLDGVLDVSGFERLRGALAAEPAALQIALRFAALEGGHPGVSGRVWGALLVECQRCLEGVQVAIEVEFACGFAGAEGAEGGGAESAREGVEILALAEDGSADLRGLLEDELILGLPVFARHPPGACHGEVAERLARLAVADDGAEDGERRKPFAELKRLLGEAADEDEPPRRH